MIGMSVPPKMTKTIATVVIEQWLSWFFKMTKTINNAVIGFNFQSLNIFSDCCFYLYD
jgi:hypothetical protein